jgi:transposase
MDWDIRLGVSSKKSIRDGLIRVAEGSPDWVIGFEDETWWSRLARPNLHAWSDKDQDLRLLELSVPKEDKSPKALAAYGMLMRYQGGKRKSVEKIKLRFIEGHPESEATKAFLGWSCERIEVLGKKTLLLIWDNATWHKSEAVVEWLGEHNRQVEREGKGVRIINCPLPKKSPWLNPIEPHWIHGKRQIVEADRLLTAEEVISRVYDYFGLPNHDYLTISEKAP